MILGRTITLGVTWTCLVVLGGVPANAQVQSKEQQGCINALNKSGQKLAATQGKDNTACIKDAGKGKLVGMNAQQCLSADRKGKVASTSAKTVSTEAAKCTVAPDFAFTGATNVNSVAVAQEKRLTNDVFGNNLTSAILVDAEGAGCQASVSKALEKYAATALKEFTSCKKSGLKDASIDSKSALEGCVGADPKQKVSGAASKLTDAITGKCGGVMLATAFPGECSGEAGSAATLGACLANAADCRTCLAIKQMDGLDVTFDCDLFDDGVVNDSCARCGDGVIDTGEVCDDGAGNDDSLPDACRTTCVPAFCGDGVVDFVEGCDDGNNVSGDGCDANCLCEPGNPAATCQDEACPSKGQLVLYAGTTTIACTNNGDCDVGTCDNGLGVCVTVTELDTGWKGIAHNGDTNDQVLTMGRLICPGPFVGGPEPCGECKVVGIDPGTGDCRCANDNRVSCDEPFQADADDCGGATCNCYFGPPLPLSAGNTPACVLNRFANDIRGTANVDLGEGLINANLRSVVYLGINVVAPCPACGGTCTAPLAKIGQPCATDVNCDSTFNAADGACGNFDPVARDGNRQGTCWEGNNAGASCDIGAYNSTFPAPASGGAGLSLDCFPASGLNVSGTGLSINLAQTTGTSALPPADVDCGFDSVPDECPCGLCTGDTNVTCTSNADCVGIGACAKVGNGNPKQNDCLDGVCTDMGGGEGECAASPPFNFCDGVARANGEGFVQCGTNADCVALGTFIGNCTLSTPKRCFLDPISATGVQDPNFPVGVATFCIGPTGNAGINTVAGLPGAGRVKNAASAATFCASNPAVQYTPGVGGCP
jgi:cysteine-rich repeat protein